MTNEGERYSPRVRQEERSSVYPNLDFSFISNTEVTDESIGRFEKYELVKLNGINYLIFKDLSIIPKGIVERKRENLMAFRESDRFLTFPSTTLKISEKLSKKIMEREGLIL